MHHSGGVHWDLDHAGQQNSSMGEWFLLSGWECVKDRKHVRQRKTTVMIHMEAYWSGLFAWHMMCLQCSFIHPQ